MLNEKFFSLAFGQIERKGNGWRFLAPWTFERMVYVVHLRKRLGPKVIIPSSASAGVVEYLLPPGNFVILEREPKANTTRVFYLTARHELSVRELFTLRCLATPLAGAWLKALSDFISIFVSTFK